MSKYNGYSEQFAVASAMVAYGNGLFERNLGEVLRYCDNANGQKIKNTWPKIWEQYKEVATRMDRFKS